MNRTASILFIALVTLGQINSSRAASKILYENDFEKLEVNKLPDEFMVLDGGFTIQQLENNKFLELPGAPLDSFGLLFGPVESGDLTVTASIFGTAKGRRFPTFAVGLGGAGGYRLQVSPGKKTLEIYRGDNLKTSVPFEWESGKWLSLKLSLGKTGESAWKIEGKAWPAAGAEPPQSTITFEEKEAPPTGRASIFASPYSTTPIRFDNIKLVAPK